ncbi:uncharacterized protein CEXT_592441 [Caerostris extrusa]|uniref:IGFBP N-terminal domain-containing protein n=1 Tax=Caerostris extrusa TaxID=172846 RepID=A0AAV4RY69_CAEEX|nr:uncharacterized protein CEXT_592441 [Caerostris extrusa]
MKVLLILAVTVAAVECFQICSPEFCKLLPNCEPKCGPGESLIKNGNCDCCGYCVLMEVVGEKCTPRYLPSIFPNKKYLMCQTGYRCDPRTRRLRAVYKSRFTRKGKFTVVLFKDSEKLVFNINFHQLQHPYTSQLFKKTLLHTMGKTFFLGVFVFLLYFIA